MKELIEAVNEQIKEAISIGQQAAFKEANKEFKNILLCGLGGSGIGGAIVSQLLAQEVSIPFVCTNDYQIPGFVGENTLVIASSYSGNTEETLAAVEQAKSKGAEICVVTSGGKLGQMAVDYGWNHAIVPGGEQPRAMIVYSIIQQLYLLKKYNLCSSDHLSDLEQVPALIQTNELEVQKEAKILAQRLNGNLPIIYADAKFGGLATRFKQQLNENSKELCWTHVLPEMTHNELVGWAGGKDFLAPVYLATDFDHPRTTARWRISKEIINKHTDHVFEIHAKGSTALQQVFYLIHLTDWVSYYLSEIKGIDPVEVDVITHLKGEMAKV